ncbi:MAG: hypothetical protein IJC59_03995 [Lachnospiraceae bacterium]|nr:hypothetical protein [Lachnospiraceae bacterium]
MKNEERLITGGYMFGSEEDVRLARGELGSIAYLEKRIDYNDIHTTLRIYEKAVQERIFKTPVGYDFLRTIQKELQKRGMPEENIPPIPLYQNFSYKEEEPIIRAPLKIKKKDTVRAILRTSVWLNIALILLAIGMFAITMMGETTNMMNYRFRLENEYAAWEEDLTEREEEIRKKERELHLE